MVGLWKCLCSAVTLSGIGTKVQQSQDLNPSPVDLSSVCIHSIALMQGQVSSQNRISCLQNNKLCTNSVHSYFIPRVHQWCWVLDCSCWSLAQLGAVMFTLNSWVQSCSHWTAAHWTAGCSHVHTEQMGAVMFTMNSLAWWLPHPQGDTSLLSSVFINFHDLDRLPRVFLHKNNCMACYETMG